jgi:hypothetical protein
MITAPSQSQRDLLRLAALNVLAWRLGAKSIAEFRRGINEILLLKSSSDAIQDACSRIGRFLRTQKRWKFFGNAAMTPI